MHKKSFNVDVDDELSDLFSKQCEERGYTKYRAVEGSLRAWVVLSPDLQVLLMNSQITDVAQLIKDKLLDAELLEKMESLSPGERHQLFSLAKQGAKIISRKK